MTYGNQADTFSRVLGVFAIVISLAAGIISYLEWRTLGSQLEEMRKSNTPHFSVITEVLYNVGDEDGDGDVDSDYHDRRQPLSHEWLSTSGTWAKVTVINNGPQDGAVRNIGLEVAEDDFYWDGEFDESTRPGPCDANQRSNDFRCQNIWPVGIDNASEYSMSSTSHSG